MYDYVNNSQSNIIKTWNPNQFVKLWSLVPKNIHII